MLVPLAYLVLASYTFLKQERRDPKNQTNLVPDETRPALQSSTLGSSQVQRLHVLDHESYHDVTVEKISPKTLGDSNNAILPPKNSTARSGCNAEHDSHFLTDHDAVFRQPSNICHPAPIHPRLEFERQLSVSGASPPLQTRTQFDGALPPASPPHGMDLAANPAAVDSQEPLRSAVDWAGDSAADSAVDTAFFSGVFTWILDGPTAESPAVAAAADRPSEEDNVDPFHDDWPYWNRDYLSKNVHCSNVG